MDEASWLLLRSRYTLRHRRNIGASGGSPGFFRSVLRSIILMVFAKKIGASGGSPAVYAAHTRIVAISAAEKDRRRSAQIGGKHEDYSHLRRSLLILQNAYAETPRARPFAPMRRCDLPLRGRESALGAPPFGERLVRLPRRVRGPPPTLAKKRSEQDRSGLAVCGIECRGCDVARIDRKGTKSHYFLLPLAAPALPRGRRQDPQATPGRRRDGPPPPGPIPRRARGLKMSAK